MACYNDCSALNLSTCEFTEEETSLGVVSDCSKLTAFNIEQVLANTKKCSQIFFIYHSFSFSKFSVNYNKFK